MKRVLCLYIPFLSTDRLRDQPVSTGDRLSSPPTKGGLRGVIRSEQNLPRPLLVKEGGKNSNDLLGFSTSTPKRIAIATITPHGQTVRIAHVNAAAVSGGIHPQQTLADAKAMLPELIIHQDDPTANRRTLESLATWASCLSPIVHIESADTLLVDVTGCQRLFGGEPNIANKALAGLSARGFTARVAIADTAGTARAVAHAHPEPMVIVPPGQSAAYLTPLPVWSLRIDAKTTDALWTVGVTTVCSLLYLPRSSLTSRFGDALLERIDQALGDLPEVLTPYEPKRALRSDFEIGVGTMRIDVLTEAIRRALIPFCKELERKSAGVRQMFVTFRCDESIRTATTRAADFSPRGCVATKGHREQGAKGRRNGGNEGTRDRGIKGRRGEGAEGTREQGNKGSRDRGNQIRALSASDGPISKTASTTSTPRVPDATAQSVTLELNLSQPTRSPHHLLSLLTVLLDQLHLHAPVDALTLWAPSLDPLDGWQEELFTTGWRDARTLSDLLDRLSARLGASAVARAQHVSDHEPRRAFEYVTVAGTVAVAAKHAGQTTTPLRSQLRSTHRSRSGLGFDPLDPSIPSAPRPLDPSFPSSLVPSLPCSLRPFAPVRPLRLLPHPIAITVSALVPEGPPIAFRFRGTQHAVAISIGPERIETGWWRGSHIQRDYYRVVTEMGLRCWLFRDRRRDDRRNEWFLHGWFD